jgi:hypothetical protein
LVTGTVCNARPWHRDYIRHQNQHTSCTDQSTMANRIRCDPAIGVVSRLGTAFVLTSDNIGLVLDSAGTLPPVDRELFGFERWLPRVAGPGAGRGAAQDTHPVRHLAGVTSAARCRRARPGASTMARAWT